MRGDMGEIARGVELVQEARPGDARGAEGELVRQLHA